MKNILLSCLLLGSLTACGFTSFGDTVRQGVAEEGAQAYDEGLANAVWFMCNAASVGSIKRRYGRTKEDAAAYKAICDGQDGVNIIEPEEAE